MLKKSKPTTIIISKIILQVIRNDIFYDKPDMLNSLRFARWHCYGALLQIHLRFSLDFAAPLHIIEDQDDLGIDHRDW